MSQITFQCYSCHQELRVSADKAGRKANCPKCRAVLTIPAGGDGGRTASGPRGPAPAPRGGPPKPPPVPGGNPFEFEDAVAEVGPRRPARRPAEDDYDEDRPRRKARPADDDEDYEDDRPRRKARAVEDDYDDDDDRRRRRRRRDEEEDDYDDEPEVRRKPKMRDKWPKVRIGLLLNFISSAILIGSAGLMCLAILLLLIASFGSGSLGLLRASEIVMKIGFVLYFALQLPAVAGYVFAIFTPNKNAGLALGITALSLGGVNLVLKLLMLINMFGPSRGMGAAGPGGSLNVLTLGVDGAVAVAVIISILVIALLCSEWIIYPLYLRAVALTAKERYSANGAMPPMFMACAIIGLWALLIILSVVAFGGGRGMTMGGARAWFYILIILSLGIFGLTTAFAAVYMRAIGSVRNGLPER